MHNLSPPVARIRADDDVIDVVGHGCTVPLTVDEARTIRDQLTAHIQMIEAEHIETHGDDEPTVEMGRRIPTYDELHGSGNDGRVTWFDTGSGPGFEVRG